MPPAFLVLLYGTHDGPDATIRREQRGSFSPEQSAHGLVGKIAHERFIVLFLKKGVQTAPDLTTLRGRP